MKNKELIKIFFSIILALAITKISSQTIFISNSPRINKNNLAKIFDIPKNIIINTKQLFALISENQINNKPSNTVNNNIVKTTTNSLQELPVTAMKQVSKGTFAYEDTNNKILYFRITDLTNYEERTVNLNGEQIKIRFPKGTLK